jgi:pilus assembly protein CpaB
MSRRTLIALLLAALAAVLAYYFISEKEAALRADVTPLKVLVAKSSIGRGLPLTEEKVAIDEIPGAYISPGAIASVSRDEVIRQWKKDYQGQFAVVPIAKGEQILSNKLSKILPGFAGVVPEGKRIMALTLDAASAVGGHMAPGNHVDILATFEHEYQNAKRTTTVVLVQNVMVTAVGDQTTLEKSAKSGPGLTSGNNTVTVCLAVSPEDATRLALSEKEGSLKLMLRSVGDEGPLDLPDQNLGSVLGPLMKVRKEEIKSAPPKRFQIIKGME